MSEHKESYILWLPSWYPNKQGPLDGDFIQRHARAVSMFRPIHVLHVIKDVEGRITKSRHTDKIVSGQLTETIIYYYIRPGKFRIWDQWLSLNAYRSIYKKEISKIIKDRGKPNLIQVYIALKAGIIGLWASRRFKIPFVVSEQWTIYLKEAKPGLSNLSIYLQQHLRRIYTNASSVMVVSNYLGNRLMELYGISRPKLIPNVVDKEIFSLEENSNRDVTRFVHISTFGYQKNPEDMIRAFQLLKKTGQQFIVDMIGPPNTFLKLMVKETGLENEIIFHGEMPQQELVNWVRRSDALLLYSRYETFGCVLIEANACGVPVIVSDIPVIHENIKDGFNGIFAKSENPEDLADKLSYFIRNKGLFDRKKISRLALENYNFSRVGKQLHEWYHEVEELVGTEITVKQ